MLEQLFAYLLAIDLVRYTIIGIASMAVSAPLFWWLARRWGDERIGWASFFAFIVYLPINYPLVKAQAFSHADIGAMSQGDTTYFLKEAVCCILNIWMLKSAAGWVQFLKGRPMVNQIVVTVPQGIGGYLLGKFFWA